MNEKDFAIGVAGMPAVGVLNKKPSYLISLDTVKGKSKLVTLFITTDMPNLLNAFVQAKGIYSDLEEEEISKRFHEILSSSPKENFVDIMFPSHRILSIRSLVFNANKPSSFVK